MTAIIVTGGKQYKVAEGDTLFIEKLPVEAGDSVTFDQVLAIIDGVHNRPYTAKAILAGVCLASLVALLYYF